VVKIKTLNGIELDLEKSNYKYKFYNYIFYFSSEFYMNKFKNEVQEFIMIETIKLQNKYKVKLNISLYLAVSFYKRIEKRGFRIVHKSNGFLIDETNVFSCNNFY